MKGRPKGTETLRAPRSALHLRSPLPSEARQGMARRRVSSLGSARLGRRGARIKISLNENAFELEKHLLEMKAILSQHATRADGIRTCSRNTVQWARCLSRPCSTLGPTPSIQLRARLGLRSSWTSPATRNFETPESQCIRCVDDGRWPRATRCEMHCRAVPVH